MGKPFAIGGLVAVLALTGALWLAHGALGVGSAGPLGWFLAPKVVRAEIVVKDARGVRDYRVDRGRVTAVGNVALTVRERDGLVVTVPVADDARIVVDGHRSTFGALTRGMHVEAIHQNDDAAFRIRATTPPAR
jgi:hypothetical protein